MEPNWSSIWQFATLLSPGKRTPPSPPKSSFFLSFPKEIWDLVGSVFRGEPKWTIGSSIMNWRFEGWFLAAWLNSILSAMTTGETNLVRTILAKQIVHVNFITCCEVPRSHENIEICHVQWQGQNTMHGSNPKSFPDLWFPYHTCHVETCKDFAATVTPNTPPLPLIEW